MLCLNTLHHSATHRNALQHTAMLYIECVALVILGMRVVIEHTATHCNTLQHTATHCNCNTLQYTAIHCSTLQDTATRCNTLQHTAAHCNTLQYCITLLLLSPSVYSMRDLPYVCVAVCCSVLQFVAVCCSVLPCVAVCCSVLQCVAVCCSVLQCVAACCSVSQCVAVCCSVLQCVALPESSHTLCRSVCPMLDLLQHTATHCNTLQHTATHNRFSAAPYVLC